MLAHTSLYYFLILINSLIQFSWCQCFLFFWGCYTSTVLKLLHLCSVIFCRGEIEKQKAHERYMKLQEQGKTDQAQKDLGNIIESVPGLCFLSFIMCLTHWLIDIFNLSERLALIRQKRADAAKKREEEKTGNFLSWPILIAGPLCFLFGIFSGILFAFSRPCSQRAEEVGSSQTCSKN